MLVSNLTIGSTYYFQWIEANRDWEIDSQEGQRIGGISEIIYH